MRPLTLSQSSEIAEFAESYAKERFGRSVRIYVRSDNRSRPSSMLVAYGFVATLVVCVSAGAWLLQ